VTPAERAEAKRYVLEALLPDGEEIRGARAHTSFESVRSQLIRTAPQWRRVFPGVKFAIRDASDTEKNSGGGAT
jgi:hypothetical protein